MKGKLLIIGSRGMLGSACMQAGSERAWDVTGVDIDEIDITSIESVASVLDDVRPDVVINCAAYTNVDACESGGFGDAMRVNGAAPGILAILCRDRNIAVTHISSDYVFNGTGPDGVMESDLPGEPMNAYGQTKRDGEIRFSEAFGGVEASSFRIKEPRAYLVRISWLFGPGARNFVSKIAKIAREKGTIRVVDDETGCPTYAPDLAERLVRMHEDQNESGIYHLTNDGSCSRLEFASAVLRKMNIDTTIDPCKLADFPRPAHIANTSILRNTKLPPLPDWEDAARRYTNSV